MTTNKTPATSQASPPPALPSSDLLGVALENLTAALDAVETPTSMTCYPQYASVSVGTLRILRDALARPAPASLPAGLQGVEADNSKCKFASGGANCITHCGDPICIGWSPISQLIEDVDGVREAIELPDVEDLAREIAQDCLSFGLSSETIARYLRSYEKRVRAAIAATTKDSHD